jgi:hypothetical protein
MSTSGDNEDDGMFDSPDDKGDELVAPIIPSLREILAMDIATLQSKLKALGVETSGKRAELQLRLIETAANFSDKTKTAPDNLRDSHSVEGKDSLAMSYELQLQFKKLDLEAAERQHKQNIEAEELHSRMSLEREIQILKARQDHELAMKQVELAVPAPPVSPIPVPRTHVFRVDTAIKLIPKFTESDVESFFISFEKIAQLNAWPQEKYAAALQAHLSGKALKVFTQLSDVDCMNYLTLKAAILRAYAFVPEVYRKRFRNTRKRYNETYSDFAFRLNVQFQRWTEGEKAYTDVERLREIVQLEQFRQGLDDELSNWLIDRNPASLADAAKLADQFVAVRGPAKNYKPVHFSKSQSNTQSDSRDEKELVLDNTDTSHPKGDNLIAKWANNHNNTIDSFKPSSGNGKPKPKPRNKDASESRVICFYCKQPGHMLSACKKLAFKNGKHGSDTAEVNLVQTKANLQNEGDEIVAPIIHPGYKNMCVSATVIKPDKSEKKVTLLRDTGALQSLFCTQAMSDFDYVPTGEYRLIKGVSGDVQRVPLVEIQIASKLATGTYLCGLIDSLPPGIDGLLGNDLCPHTTLSETDVLAVTRAQTTKGGRSETPDNAAVALQVQSTTPTSVQFRDQPEQSATDLCDTESDLNLA